jgi:molybdopterin synthase sulfur carrier subunit
MKTEVLFFGQLTDITGETSMMLEGVQDTNALQAELVTRFPALQQAKFRIAVNNRIIDNNTTITEGSKVALMPPFSGG